MTEEVCWMLQSPLWSIVTVFRKFDLVIIQVFFGGCNSVFQCAYMWIFFELFYYDITKYGIVYYPPLKQLDKWWMSIATNSVQNTHQKHVAVPTKLLPTSTCIKTFWVDGLLHLLVDSTCSEASNGVFTL